MSGVVAEHVRSEQEREAPRPSHARTRTCVGCGERVELGAGTDEFVRLILGPNGQVAVDARGGGFGRGAHLHPQRACLERAVQRGLARSAKGQVHTLVSDAGSAPAQPADDGGSAPTPPDAAPGEVLSVASLARAIQASMDRRIEGLLAAAVRARHIARGADAVTGACQRGEAHLVLVARDAAAAADLTEVRRAVAEGRGVAWGDKQRLGQIVDPRAARVTNGTESVAGVGVIAVTDPRIAGALRAAVHTADACAAMGSGGAGAGAGGRRKEKRTVPVTMGETPNPPARPVEAGQKQGRRDVLPRSARPTEKAPGSPQDRAGARRRHGGRGERAGQRGTRLGGDRRSDG